MKVYCALMTAMVGVISILTPQVAAQVHNITAASFAMKLGLLKETKEAWANFILNQLASTEVKDMEFEHGHVFENVFTILQPLDGGSIYDKTHLETDHRNNTIGVSIKGLRVCFTSQ